MKQESLEKNNLEVKEKKDETIQALIVSAGEIDLDLINYYTSVSEFKYIIGVDKGIEYLKLCNIKPTHLVGDFDSINKEVLEEYIGMEDITTRIFNPNKEGTDTELAVNLAIDLGVDRIFLLGGTGRRLDHTFGNIYISKTALDKGVNCFIIDKYNRIFIAGPGKVHVNKGNVYKYITVFPYEGHVKGLSIKGVKHPIDVDVLEKENTQSISNQIIDKECTIEIGQGHLIIVQSRD